MSNAKPKMDRMIVATCTSTSGKYTLMLCEHIVGGKFCYDVVAFNHETAMSISRHYREAIDDAVNKAEALRVYDEYREKLQAPAKPQEGDEQDPLTWVKPN